MPISFLSKNYRKSITLNCTVIQFSTFLSLFIFIGYCCKNCYVIIIDQKKHTLRLDFGFTILYIFELIGFSGRGTDRAESVDWSSEYESCAQPALSTPRYADTSADTPGLDDTLKPTVINTCNVHIFEKLMF